MDKTFPAFKVEVYHDLVPCVAGIPEKDFFTDAAAMVRAWGLANAWIEDTFHGRVPARVPTPAPNSYGHLVCLGAPLRYSETAEPNISPAANSLDEAIEMLRAARDMDFTAQPIFRQYAEMSRAVREVYPECGKISGLGFEGPVTSCALFRGMDFYYDVMDEPEKSCAYLRLMTESVVAFRRQLALYNGQDDLPARGGGALCDDLASMLPPSLWDSMVIPFWNQYYEGTTLSPSRFLHCEAATPAHLPYIEKAHITHYQPSVSPKLTLRDMAAHVHCQFDWLLYAYQVTEMDDAQIDVWLREAIAYHPMAIRTQIGSYAVKAGKVDRIAAFVDIAEALSKEG